MRKASLLFLLVGVTASNAGCKGRASTAQNRDASPGASKSDAGDAAGAHAGRRKVVSRGDIRISNIELATKRGRRPSRTGHRGEATLLFFSARGFSYASGQANVTAAIEVHRGATRISRVDNLAVLSGAAPTRHPGTVRAALGLALPRDTPPGNLRVTLTINDNLSKRSGHAIVPMTLAGEAPKKKANPHADRRQ